MTDINSSSTDIIDMKVIHEQRRDEENGFSAGADREGNPEAAAGNSGITNTNTKEESASVSNRSNSSSPSVNQMLLLVHHRRLWLAAGIVMIGAIAGTALLVTGVVAAQQDQTNAFDRLATEITTSIEDAWQDYEMVGLWIHESCGSRRSSSSSSLANNSTTLGLDICTREEFHKLYRYIQSHGIEFSVMNFLPNVTHAQRAALEEESRSYLASHYPDTISNYQGITGLFINQTTGQNSRTVQPPEPYYFPVHYLEPVEGNVAALDLNIYSLESRARQIDYTVRNWVPTLTDRIKLLQDTDPNAYSIILKHPGIPPSAALDDNNDNNTTTVVSGSISQMVIRVPDLLARAGRQHLTTKKGVLLFDATKDNTDGPVFMGGGKISITSTETMPETTLAEVQAEYKRSLNKYITIADRQWIVVVVALPGTYEPNVWWPILGGCLIWIASILLAVWLHAHLGRMSKLNQVKSQADREKAAIIVETAHRQAQTERRINEYLAHEVRTREVILCFVFIGL